MTNRIEHGKLGMQLSFRSAILLALAAALALFVIHVFIGHTVPARDSSWISSLYAASGLLVGALIGLTGVGGGSLMAPLLVLLFGFHPSTAVGTDLLFASVTKSAGTLVHGSNRTVDWTITGRMALGSVLATVATAALLFIFHRNGDAGSAVIAFLLGIMLLLTAVTLFFRDQIFDFAAQHALTLGPRATTISTIILGAILGVLVTLSSVGAGAVGVTVLIFLYPKMPVARIVGSDIAHAVPLTLIAGAGHWLLGSVNLALLGSLLIGSVPGIIIGSHFTAKIPETYLRMILAATLMLLSAKLVF